MKYRGKLFGAALGFTFGGPIGALLGGALGAAVDAVDLDDSRAVTDGVLHYLLAVAASDGPVNGAETGAIRGFFLRMAGRSPGSGGSPSPGAGFGAGGGLVAESVDRYIRRALNQPASIPHGKINEATSYEQRLFLLKLGYEVAVSDGPLNPAEDECLSRSGSLFQLHAYDCSLIKTGYVRGRSRSAESGAHPGSGSGGSGGFFSSGGGAGPDVFRDTDEYQDPYVLLEVSPACSREELQKAYRRLAAKYHPDRVAHLGQDFIDLATVKFNQISRAYECICRERGL